MVAQHQQMTTARHTNDNNRPAEQTTRNVDYDSVYQPFIGTGTLWSILIARGTSRSDTKVFFLFQMDRNIIYLYLVMHEKRRLLRAYVCNTVIVA